MARPKKVIKAKEPVRIRQKKLKEKMNLFFQQANGKAE